MGSEPTQGSLHLHVSGANSAKEEPAISEKGLPQLLLRSRETTDFCILCVLLLPFFMPGSYTDFFLVTVGSLWDCLDVVLPYVPEPLKGRGFGSPKRELM